MGQKGARMRFNNSTCETTRYFKDDLGTISSHVFEATTADTKRQLSFPKWMMYPTLIRPQAQSCHHTEEQTEP